MEVSPVLEIGFGPPTAESKNLKNHLNFDVGDLFFRSPALWSSQNVFGPPTAGRVVVDFKDRGSIFLATRHDHLLLCTIIWFKVVFYWSSPSHALFMNLTEKQARCSLHFSRPVWTCPVLGCDKSGLRKKRNIAEHERYHRSQAAKRQRLEEVMGPADISLSNSGEV